MSEKATIGRRWPALLVVALSLLAPAAARAGFTSIYTLGSGDAGRELANNTVYKVESDLTLTNTGTGPGLSVASGATVVLYIKKGATLTVNGGNSSGRSAGDAGLRVLSGRTLVVTGGGKLVATGGNAGNGVNGGDAGSCSLNMSGDSHGGQGGAGGNGGAGASAGIGGYGGYGGYGGTRPNSEEWVETNDTSDYDRNGTDGNNGAPGGNGDDMGTVYLLGSVDVTATGGSGGSGGSPGGNTGGEHDSNWSGVNWYYVGGAGGGGGGAGGIAPYYAIGGGGGGGGGGGSGGNGGLYWKGSGGTGTANKPDGAGGQGGWDNGVSSSRTEPDYAQSSSGTKYKHGGYRGSGGAKGANGGNGTLYRDSGVTLNATYASATSATTHSAIEYSLTFSDGQRVSESTTARLGYAYPTAPIPPSRPGWAFHGWFTEEYGNGTKYYNGDGTAAAEEWGTIGDLTLYAYWTLEDPHLADTISVNGVGLVGGQTQTGDGWYYDSSTGYVWLQEQGRTYVITGNDPAGEFSIYAHASCTVVMSNLTINASSNVNRPPFENNPNSSPVLMFAGTNHLYGPVGFPAIYTYGVGTLTIRDGGGVVYATGGANAPGIGGAPGTSTGSLKIEGGTIEAYGGDYGPGIGSAKDGGFGSITISGGIVTAVGKGISFSGGGAGIGGGASQPGGVIRITGGEVTATGGDSGAGIGGGSSAAGGNISISGGTVNATGGRVGAGIGGGVNGDGGTIAITGGAVRATGGDGGAGIGGGDCGAGGSITISDGDVVARGTGYGAGIGGGRNKIGGTITITGGHVDAAGDARGAGIGGGSGCVPGTISISGGIVMAVGGTNGCAGVGSGYEGWTYAGTGSISISGGTIYASGSRESPDIGRRSNEHNVIVVFTGGAIYVDKEKVKPDPKDGFEKRVFPVDLDIGLPNSLVTEFELGTRRSGFENIYTNDRGILRIWLASSIYSYGIRITMEDGSEHVFCFKVGDDGKVTSSDFLVVNGVIITGDVDQIGAEWTYTKSTSELALLNDATVSGVSTSGTFRIVVADDSVTNLTLANLTIVARSDKYASAVVVSNSACSVTLSGDNIIAAKGQYAAGVEVASNSVLRVTGDGSLAAFGGKNGAGIGSRGGFTTPGRIVIESGTVIAQGGEKAAGIGGGVSSNLTADNIVITGGRITATGGAIAAGIGSGNSNAAITNGAVRISGGTILATKGDGINANVGDLILSRNVDTLTGYDQSLCITGGSVHGANLDAKPDPVDADGAPLRYLLFTNMTAGAAVSIASPDIPATYGMNDVVVDPSGSVCLWLPKTDSVRIVSVNGVYFIAGGLTNNVFNTAFGSADPPDSIRDGGKTTWRVEIPGLGENKTVAIAGLEDAGITSAGTYPGGSAFVYLPNGVYRFTVDGNRWMAIVKDAPTVAIPVPATDFKVNGTSIEDLSGDGWSYDGISTVTLSGAGPFVLSGTLFGGVVDVTNSCSIMLSNAVVNAVESGTGKGAVNLRPGVAVALTLVGENAIDGYDGRAGIAVPSSASLSIDSDASTDGQADRPALAVTGGQGAAGIGADSGAAMGDVVIVGGIVTATGAPGIGGTTGGSVSISGGTVASAGAGGAKAIGGDEVVFTGGSVAPAFAEIGVAPTDGLDTVHRVTVPDLVPNAVVTNIAFEVGGRSYGVRDIVADASGAIYLWLPDGTYDFNVSQNGADPVRYAAIVAGKDMTAARFYPQNVFVNDVDIGFGYAEGWTFSSDARIVALSGPGPFTITGATTDLCFRVDADCAVVLDGLSVSNGTVSLPPFNCGASSVALAISGTNSLVSATYGIAGIRVTGGASLAISDVASDGLQPSALFTAGGNNAAGIGGNDREGGGSITIASGAVAANGGDYAAALGGGNYGNSGRIEISGGKVTAKGGMPFGAGIGGGRSGVGETILISGGEVIATGGNQAAGIGGGYYSGCGSVVISGGIVRATSPRYAPGIGCGDNGRGGIVRIEGGTVTAIGDVDYSKIDIGRGGSGGPNSVTFTGGAIFAGFGRIVPTATNAADEAVFPVDFAFGAPFVKVESIEISRDGAEYAYGMKDVYTDEGGNLRIWLPNGSYVFFVDGERWTANVADDAAIAVKTAETGVFVNGVEAVKCRGEGWTYDPDTLKLILFSDGPYVLSGTNTAGRVRVRVETNTTVTISNLCLKATANRCTPFAIASNVAARVWFTGTNTLESGRYCAALEVPGVSYLEIGGDGWLYAKGGATSDSWGCPAIGISDGMYYEFQHQAVTITGGNFVAISGAEGTVDGIDDPVIAGGNIYIGYDSIGRYTLAFIGATTPQGEDASCVEITGLRPNAPVEFTGLPNYYNASNIYANADGKVYIYLKAVYSDEDAVFFTANGTLYRAVVWNSSAVNTATKVNYVAPDALQIESVALSDDAVTLVVSARPDGWLTAATALILRVRAAAALPLPADAAALLPRESVGVSTNGDGTATLAVPRAADVPRTFYRVEIP